MFENFKSALRSASQRAEHRRQYRALLALDDHLLRDIGVTRNDVHTRASGHGI